jgi:glycosidase
MRVTVAALFALVLAGCPTQHGGGGGGTDNGNGSGGRADAGGTGGGPDGGFSSADAAPICEVPATCEVRFEYPANGVSTVELRGDFADDGWENGISLALDGDVFATDVELGHRQVVEYKFLIDGDEEDGWVLDPNNPNTVGEGVFENSVITANCDECGYGGAGYDWRDAIMYFVMTDRFADGESSYNDPVDGVPEAANFQGGDLVGLRQVIESGYFGDLGINTIWLTAPVDNAKGAGKGIDDDYLYSAYHGYWPRDLDAVERRIGTYDDLVAVIEAAHERDLRVVLDYVMNHVHTESSVFNDHPEWFVPLGDCGVCGQGCDWDALPDRELCWFTDYLPSFDFRRADARAFSVQNAVDWAIDLGIDGYRLDAVKHIDKRWITELRAALDAQLDGDDRFYLVGETFSGDRDLLKDYIHPPTMLDGQFDFPLRAELAETILRRSRPLSDLGNFLDGNDDFYGPGAIMGTFIGNHDVPRPVHLAENTPLFGAWDDGKSRAWQNLPNLPDYAAPFERLAVAYTVLMTIPGVPLIYYGDEIGMPGAGDPDNRRFMQWENYSEHQLWLRDQIAGLAHARSQHRALRAGQRNTLGATADVYVYEMVAPGDRVYVALNRGDNAAGAQGLPAGTYRDVVSGESVTAPINLPARSARVLVRE